MAGYSDEEILDEIRQMVPELPHLVRAEEAERLRPRLVEILERAEKIRTCAQWRSREPSKRFGTTRACGMS